MTPPMKPAAQLQTPRVPVRSWRDPNHPVIGMLGRNPTPPTLQSVRPMTREQRIAAGIIPAPKSKRKINAAAVAAATGRA